MSGGWRRSTVSGPQRLELDAWTAPDLSATAPALDSTRPTMRVSWTSGATFLWAATSPRPRSRPWLTEKGYRAMGSVMRFDVHRRSVTIARTWEKQRQPWPG